MQADLFGAGERRHAATTVPARHRKTLMKRKTKVPKTNVLWTTAPCTQKIQLYLSSYGEEFFPVGHEYPTEGKLHYRLHGLDIYSGAKKTRSVNSPAEEIRHFFHRIVC